MWVSSIAGKLCAGEKAGDGGADGAEAEDGDALRLGTRVGLRIGLSGRVWGAWAWAQ